MEIIIELIVYFFIDVLIQVMVETLFEFGYYSLAETFKRKRLRNPLLASIGYLIWGGIFGVVTVLVFPALMIKSPTLRTLNLLVSPVVAGLAMSAIGAWRRKKGQDTLRIDSFAYGALFAFGLALVRLLHEVYFG